MTSAFGGILEDAKAILSTLWEELGSRGQDDSNLETTQLPEQRVVAIGTDWGAGGEAET